MGTAPNQKLVKVQRSALTEPFSQVSCASEQNAAQRLRGNAFKAWRYFATNRDGYVLALSGAVLQEAFGLKKDAYQAAVRELIAAGFLVRESGQRYTFYEFPENQKRENPAFGGEQKRENPAFKSGKNRQYGREIRQETIYKIYKDMNDSETGVFSY